MLMREKHDVKGENESLRIKLKKVEAELKAERVKNAPRHSSDRMEVDGGEDETRLERHPETQNGTPSSVEDGYPDIRIANDALELTAANSLPAICKLSAPFIHAVHHYSRLYPQATFCFASPAPFMDYCLISP